jgi:hypothetical protein
MTIRAILLRLLVRCALLLLLAAPGWCAGEEVPKPKPPPAPQALPLQEALRKARVGGKYEMLLRQIKVPHDFDSYGEFRDLGHPVKEIAGTRDLLQAHWVYVYPYWYAWRDLTQTSKVKRQWGPEQATGPPDTWPMAGDIPTAWASLTRDSAAEWLLLEYPEPVAAKAVVVYETYNPGALARVTVFRLDGEEVEVWKGKDPTPPGSGKGISEVHFRIGFKTNRVKLYLDCRPVPGWNEIDAVGLRDSADKIHWATSAAASSTYAEQGGR